LPLSLIEVTWDAERARSRSADEAVDLALQTLARISALLDKPNARLPLYMHDLVETAHGRDRSEVQRIVQEGENFST